MRRAVIALAAAWMLSASALGFARDERLAFWQEPAGEVVVSIRGAIFYCDYPLGGFNGGPAFARNGSTIEVVSNFYPGECPPPPPDFVPPPQQPYQLAVNVGVLPDGLYSVRWSYVASIPALNQVYTSSFRIVGGVLPAPQGVPGPSVSLLMALALCILGAGVLAIRSPTRYHSGSRG